MADHLHLIADLSMRDYHRSWKLKRAGLDWRRYWLERALPAPTCHVARLRADRSFASEEDRVRAFVAAGWGSRATYFNHARKLSPPAAALHLPLKNTRPPAWAEEDPTLLDLLQQWHGELGQG